MDQHLDILVLVNEFDISLINCQHCLHFCHVGNNLADQGLLIEVSTDVFVVQR